MMHQERQRQSFDLIAEQYDAVRPYYPDALIHDVIQASSLKQDDPILEIGSGSGHATLPFAQLGYPVTCIEPGASLLRIAQHKLKAYPQVRYVNTTFEQWPVQANSYQLIISAQAFHWIDPSIGYAKSASSLKDGGYIALFWSMIAHDNTPLLQKINNLYKEQAAELSDHIDKTEERRKHNLQAGLDELISTGLFRNATLKEYSWQERYSSQDYIKLLDSFSDHRELPDSRREQLYEEVFKIIEAAGGILHKPYITALYFAQKS